MYTCYASAQFKEYKYAVLELKTGGTVVHYLSDKPKLKYDNNRLLVISVSRAVRQSKATAHARNKYICEIADKILFVGVTEKSSLYPLTDTYKIKHINLTA